MQQLKCLEYLLIVVAGFSLAYGAVRSRVGDVEVFINETMWVCDKIMCPPNTDYCRVTKQKATADATQLTRTNTCYSKNDAVLNQAITYEPIPATQRISVNITASRYGVTSHSNGDSSYTDGGSSYVSSGNSYGNSYVNTGYEVDNDAILENIKNIDIQVQQQVQDIERNIQNQLANAFRW